MDEHDFFDDPDAHDTRHHPFTSPDRFRQAFDWYMAGIGMRHEPVVAAAVFSAFTLVDPAGVLSPGNLGLPRGGRNPT